MTHEPVQVIIVLDPRQIEANQGEIVGGSRDGAEALVVTIREPARKGARRRKFRIVMTDKVVDALAGAIDWYRSEDDEATEGGR